MLLFIVTKVNIIIINSYLNKKHIISMQNFIFDK